MAGGQAAGESCDSGFFLRSGGIGSGPTHRSGVRGTSGQLGSLSAPPPQNNMGSVGDWQATRQFRVTINKKKGRSEPPTASCPPPPTIQLCIDGEGRGSLPTFYHY